MSVRRSVRPSISPCVTRFFIAENERFLYENPTLTLLNLLGVLGVLYVLNVLNVLYVLNMPMDASLAYWALLTNTASKKWKKEK